MGVFDYILILLIAAAAAFAIRSMVRTKRKGGCASCPNAANCCGRCPSKEK